jgi:hypothetical protein
VHRGCLRLERLAKVGELVHDVTELRDVRLHSAGRGLFQPCPVQLSANIDEVLRRLGAVQLCKSCPGIEGVSDAVDVRQLCCGQGADNLSQGLSILLLPRGLSCFASVVRVERRHRADVDGRPQLGAQHEAVHTLFPRAVVVGGQLLRVTEAGSRSGSHGGRSAKDASERERCRRPVGVRDVQTVNLLMREVIGSTSCMKSGYESSECASARGGERLRSSS